MGLAINRSEFLQGDLQGRNRPLRPPWSIPEKAFRDHCSSCGDCLAVCPTDIIEFGRGKLPVINFNKGECLFCEDCLSACKTKALYKKDDQLPWSNIADIDSDKCLAYKAVECRSCHDTCESRAIKFAAIVGNISKPHLDTDLCNGCGACYAVCPTNAISILPTQRNHYEH